MSGKRSNGSRGSRKKSALLAPSAGAPPRRSLGRATEGASFPAPPPLSELPSDYVATLAEIKRRVREERLRVVVAASSAMVLLYWDLGRMILERQERAGWGAKVIDRLAADLREAFPDMKGFSPRNLLFMRGFAEACPDREKVKQVVSQLPWGHVVRLVQRVKEPGVRDWYARQSIQHGWSRSVLELQIDRRAHEREGRAISNFKATLPPTDSDMAAQAFKDPYLFLEPLPLRGRRPPAPPRRQAGGRPPALPLQGQDRGRVRPPASKRPIGVSGWETQIVDRLPEELKGSLPTVEEIEAELGGRGP